MAYQGPTITALLVLMSFAPLLAGCQKPQEPAQATSDVEREHPDKSHEHEDSGDSGGGPY
jgi:hypothetical protein